MCFARRCGVALVAAACALGAVGAVPAGGGGALAGPDVLHPPKLSVDLKDATLGEVAAALNKELGGEYLRADGRERGGCRRSRCM
jgi:hypothetical protein